MLLIHQDETSLILELHYISRVMELDLINENPAAPKPTRDIVFAPAGLENIVFESIL